MTKGSVIGPYRTIDVLGQGGMGIVYRARHTSSERLVALKTVRPQAPSWMSSIRREIQALTRVHHPGVVRILDSGTHQGMPWYAMALLEGETLRAFGKRVWSRYRSSSFLPVSNPLSATELVTDAQSSATSPMPGPAPTLLPPAGAGELVTILGLFRELCSSLAYLHGEGFINCDLKPENVLIVEGYPIIIDFGLTARVPRASREALDSQGLPAGTLPYMSPEQIRGELLDARSDLYAAGCMLYELITGRPPFLPPSLAQQHLDQTPPPLSDHVTDLPPGLESLVARLLEKDLLRRSGFGDEVSAALAQLADAAGAADLRGQARSKRSAAPYLYRSSFVGRRELLRSLRVLHADATRGAGAVVFVGGESGAGKTRLMLEVMREVRKAHLPVIMTENIKLATEGDAAVPAEPLHAVRPLLQAIADYCYEGGPAVTERVLGSATPVLAVYEPALAGLPAPPAGTTLLPLSADASRRRLLRSLRDVLQAFARERPLLWVIDDLGWADELSLAFLNSLNATFLAETPLLVAATYRTEELNSDVAGMLDVMRHAHQYRLPALTSADIQSMVGDMLALRTPPDRLVHFVASEAGGNPFFVAEYLQAAVASQVLYRDHTHTWTLARTATSATSSGHEFESLPLPRSLHELISQRFARLGQAAHRAAIAAAVLGREVDSALLYAVADLPETSLQHAIDELLRVDVLSQAGPERLRFVHDKLREFAYASIQDSTKKTLHLRAATVIEDSLEQVPNKGSSWVALGLHFSVAERPERAAHYLTVAADRARETYANQDAIRLYVDALKQLELARAAKPANDAELSSQEAVSREALADVLVLVGERVEARRAYDLAREYWMSLEPVAGARVLRKLGKTHELEHAHDTALAFYLRAQAALGGDAEPAAATRHEWVQAQIEPLWVYYWQARLQEMDEAIARVEAHVLSHGAPIQLARYHQARLLANCRRDRYALDDATLELATASLQAARDATALTELPMAQFMLGFSLLLRGTLAEGLSELQRAEQLARRAGDSALLTRCLTYLTVCHRLQHHEPDVERLAASSLELATSLGLREYIAAAWANEAWFHLRRGAEQRAATLALQALETWAALTLKFPFQWLALEPQLEIALRRGEVSAASSAAVRLLSPDQQQLPAATVKLLETAHSESDEERQRVRLDEALHGFQSIGPFHRRVT